MANSAVAEAPTTENADNNLLQPFFVLHKASSKKSTGKTRRRIDLSRCSSKISHKLEAETAEEEYDDSRREQLRTETFNYVWSKIESTIKDVLRNINVDVFNDIHQWVDESFTAIRSRGMSHHSKATPSYPIVTDATCRQIATGLVFTKTMEFVDDLLTFEDLGLHLKSHGCHVANLSSLDFSAKNGIGGCLRGLLRQFLMVNLDAADISVLASWYSEQGNYENPIVVIIDDMERCCGSVLSDFILTLSEWVVKIPMILILGVATTFDASTSILPSNALQYLSSRKFILGSPAERMDAIIEAVLVKQCSGFSLGHKVAVFLRNYFLRHDGTLTSFIKALKIAVAQHICSEPLSSVLSGSLSEEDSQGFWSKKHVMLPEIMLKQAFDLPSCRRNKLDEPNAEIWAHGLSELKRLQRLWSSLVLCLYEAGKYHKVNLLDLYCEVLDPQLYDSSASDNHLGLGKIFRMSSSGRCVHGQYPPSLEKGGLICQAIRKVRDLPAARLCQLLKSWENHTEGINEIHEKVRELQSLLKFEDGKSLQRDLRDLSKKHTTRNNLNIEKEAKALNEKAAALMECLVRDNLQPIECIPFHEVVCFKNVDKLQSALIGDPRRTIQADLLEFHKFLKCSCCNKSGNLMLPSMHDTSIMYMLAQEHGDLINLHDWYQSFKATVLPPTIKAKQRLKHSPSPKKRKVTNESHNKSEASVQAQFCRAITELQITGLLRMPSKRRPDYVQRVAFGL
ncbi:origin of replication complex subunit 3 [Cornus florida]|uniref:origin of replication complex subunit 3 n=1 Tax=Cornus florida TaxID=4283 RepID=UPI0028977056|nr:origin of replication complex subunit 3 [Cornus florida]